MSGFDDEFGLFGEDAEPERRSALPARRIGSEHGDDEPEGGARPSGRPARGRRRSGDEPRAQSRPRTQRDNADPWAPARRASELLVFLAQRLVSKPNDVNVELFTDETGEPVIELVVDSEDIGKVIGRNGRVAHALRTLVRATAESRVGVDILNSEEAAEPVGDDA